MKTLYLIVKSPTFDMKEDLQVFNDKKTRDDYFDAQLKSLKQAGHHIQFHGGKFMMYIEEHLKKAIILCIKMRFKL